MACHRATFPIDVSQPLPDGGWLLHARVADEQIRPLSRDHTTIRTANIKTASKEPNAMLRY
jgi:hypothetical protein